MINKNFMILLLGCMIFGSQVSADDNVDQSNSKIDFIKRTAQTLAVAVTLKIAYDFLTGPTIVSGTSLLLSAIMVNSDLINDFIERKIESINTTPTGSITLSNTQNKTVFDS